MDCLLAKGPAASYDRAQEPREAEIEIHRLKGQIAFPTKRLDGFGCLSEAVAGV